MFSRLLTRQLKAHVPPFLLILIVTLAVSSMSFAQTDTGRVSGAIQDQSGAVIPGASVKLTNVETNRTQTAQSDASGQFTFNALPRGHYQISIQAANFRSANADFILEVSQFRAVNFTLQPGEVTTTVNITDEVPLVDTASSQLGEVIQGRQITELPLNGRNFTQLALLTPGVTRGDYGNISSGVGNNAETFRNGETGGAALAVNGLRQQSNNFILDGVDNNESLVNTIVFFPPAEAIQEFRVDTSIAPAEFGRAGGAIVETSFKSGTNAIHGSAFEFLRNSAFDANPNYFTQRGTPQNRQQPFKRNQFGGSVGFPIIKDKLFLFGDYQGLRQDQPQNADPNHTVPTLLMRQGNFSQLLGTNMTTAPNPAITGCTNTVVIPGAIYNPQTCQAYSGNIIPSGQINAAGLKYLNAFPLPTNNNIIHNYTVLRKDIRHFNDFDARVDFVATAKDLIFGRFSYGQDNFTLTPSLIVLPSGFGSGDNYAHPRSGVLGYTRTFSPSVVNDFRIAYTRDIFGYNPPFQGEPLSASLGIVNANRSPLLGGGALIGGFNTELEYTGDGGPYRVPEPTYQLLDTVSYTHGRHSFRFGGNHIRREVDFFQGNDAKGYFFIGPGTGDFTGYEVSELLTGFVDRYDLGSLQATIHTRNYELGWFGQDDWRVSNRLTLNLGVRYDLYTPPYEINNQQSNFNLQTGTLLLPGQGGLGRSLVHTDYNNFAPRVGFAYDLTGRGKTVLRGGYGIFYFLDRGGVGNQLGNNPDFNGISSYNASNGYRITFTGQAPLNSNNPTAATAALPPPTNTVNPANPTNVSVIADLPNNQISSVQQYNLQVQQEVAPNTTMTMAYVGDKQDHLMTYSNFHAVPLGAANTKAVAFPNLGTVTVGGASGTGHYNSFQAQLNRRFANGFQFTSSYTWAHAIDDSSGGFSTQCGGTCGRIFVTPALGGLLALNKGNSDLDQRHAFVFSAIYELPYGRGKKFGGGSSILSNVLGNWQLNTIVSLGSGTPFDIYVNGNPQNRVDQIGTAVLNGPHKQYINYAAFAAPPKNAAGVFLRAGTLGRNAFAGPGYHTADVSLFKNFNITERIKTELRVEAFNVANTPEFTNPDNNFGDGPTNFGFLNGTRQSSERELEFVLRFTF